nr:hypothetical protein [uncultured Roseateles sp.]
MTTILAEKTAGDACASATDTVDCQARNLMYRLLLQVALRTTACALIT